MKKIYQALSSLTFILLFISSVTTANAQVITNGIFDKASYAVLTSSQVPDSWQSVPSTDANCLAIGTNKDTPDLVDQTNPNPGAGITGNPQTGDYYVSGMYSAYGGGTNVFHEGVQQSVNSFTIGVSVTISFYQTVDKQINCLDQSGGWAVYFDNTLAGTTTASSSALDYDSNSLVWDLRTVTFTPTATTHTIKFLPYDADGDPGDFNTAKNEALRMGLDNVSIATPLPVKLTQFDVDCQKEMPVLTWSTASEINNDYFTVERSEDASNFEAIGTVIGNGNSSIINNYTWTDDNPIDGTAYYRLKQTDFNGVFEYHGIRTASCKQWGEISVYPNPFENSFTVQLSENATYPLKVEVLDYLGRSVYFNTIETTLTVITLDELTTGTYSVKVFNESIHLVERMVKTN